MYDIIFSMHAITRNLYDITHLYVWHQTHCNYDIISNLNGINHTAFMTTQWLYLISHPKYLTSQPLYLCRHTCCTDDITTRLEVITLGIRMPSYTLYMTSHLYVMASMLSIYDITTTAFMTSDLLYMTSQPRCMTFHPLSLWHHSHYICVIIPTMFGNSYPVYLTSITLS